MTDLRQVVTAESAVTSVCRAIRRGPRITDWTAHAACDALTLALIGWHQRTGSPWADLPATHTRAMAKVHS